MGMECKYGQMEPNTKDNGFIIKQRERVHFGMLKEMFTMVSLETIRLTAMAPTLI